MEKMIVADKTEVAIVVGAGVGPITAVAENWEDLGRVAETIRKKGNLDNVQFKINDSVTGEYENLTLESPLFTMTDIVGGKIHATFCIRQKTEMELAIEQLQKGQEIQDGALLELAGMMGGEV